MARPYLQNVSWSDVSDIKTRYMKEHGDLVAARKTDRIPVMDQFNIFARFCDLVVGKAKAEGAADPLAHLHRILEANPSWMARQMRTPTEELERLYTPVPPDMKDPLGDPTDDGGAGDGVPGQGDSNSQNKGDNAKGNPQGDDNDGTGDRNKDSQGDGKGDGDSQDGDGDSQDGDGDGDSQDGDGDSQSNGKDPWGGDDDGTGDRNDTPKDDTPKDGDGIGGDGKGDGDLKDNGPQDGDRKDGDGVDKPQDQDQDQDQDQQQDDDTPPSVFRDELHKDIALQFEKGIRSLINIIGPAGSGKTYGVREEAKLFGAKVFLQTAVKRDTELFGKTGLEVVDGASKTVFKPSKLVQGLRYANEHPDERVILVQDEFDVMPNPVKAPLFSLLNHPYVLEVDGEDIYMPMNCVFIAISNTAGHGGNDMHPDRELVDVAALDRFDFYVLAGFEHETALQIAKNDVALVDFLEDWNNSVYESGNLRYLATYRSIEHAYKTQKAGHPLTKFVPTLTKGGSEADARQIYEGLKNHRGKYPQAVKAYLDNIPREACFL